MATASAQVNYYKGGTDWISGTNNGAPIASNQCNGMNQSPLNIVDGVTSGNGQQYNAVFNPALAPLQLSYSPQTSYTVEVNDHTLELMYNTTTAANDGITIPLVGFLPIKQFHFHYPSEHLLNGVAWPLEMHMVHTGPTSNGTKFGVIGVVFAVSPDPNYSNNFINALLSTMPSAASVASGIVLPALGATASGLDVSNVYSPGSLGPSFNLMTDIFPVANPNKYYSYSGSLTTPPCTEGLYWHFLPTPILISQPQLIQMTNLLAAAQEGISRGADNRPTQPQNGRQVSRSFKNPIGSTGGKKKGGKGLLSVL